MVLQHWDPVYELRRMREAMDRRWRGPALAAPSTERKRWAIPVDVVEEAEEILVRASLPGVKLEDIDVSIEDSVPAIRGESAESKAEKERKEGGYLIRERRTGAFHRSLRLPDTVDTDKARTHYENGILTVTLPKAESKKAKHLKVTAGSTSAGEAADRPVRPVSNPDRGRSPGGASPVHESTQSPAPASEESKQNHGNIEGFGPATGIGDFHPGTSFRGAGRVRELP